MDYEDPRISIAALLPISASNHEDTLVWAEKNQAPVPPGNRLRRLDGAIEREVTE